MLDFRLAKVNLWRATEQQIEVEKKIVAKVEIYKARCSIIWANFYSL